MSLEIDNSPYILVVEVTNGLTDSNFEFKVNEALWAQQHIRRKNKTAEIKTALIFTKNENMINSKRFELDYLLQIKTFKQNESIQALAQALLRDDRKEYKNTVEYFIREILKGKNLNELFYNPEHKYETKIKTYIEQDNRLIGDIKGNALEEYTGIILKELMPRTTIIDGYKYKRKNRQMDIDHIILNTADFKKLLCTKEFKNYKTTDEKKTTYHNKNNRRLRYG